MTGYGGKVLSFSTSRSVWILCSFPVLDILPTCFYPSKPHQVIMYAQVLVSLLSAFVATNHFSLAFYSVLPSQGSVRVFIMPLMHSSHLRRYKRSLQRQRRITCSMPSLNPLQVCGPLFLGITECVLQDVQFRVIFVGRICFDTEKDMPLFL